MFPWKIFNTHTQKKTARKEQKTKNMKYTKNKRKWNTNRTTSQLYLMQMD